MATAQRALTLDPKLLQRLKGIELKSRFLVRGLYNNRHRTTDFGASNEFIEHRDYQPGDDIRTIDWRAFARTDRLFVKRFEQEANMNVHILLDTSESMRVPTGDGRPTKLELAATIAGATATMVVAQQDSAGLCFIGDRLEEWIPPRQGQHHLALLFQHLGMPPGRGGGNFGTLAEPSMRRIGRRGVVFVLTDAIDDPQPLFHVLKGFMVREQDVTLFQVMDRDELTFPFQAMTDFRHPETGQRIMGEPLALRRRYLDELGKHLKLVEDFCGRTGVDYVRVHNDEDLIKILASHFLRRLLQRKRGRRGRGTC